jgi:hypothetical protein
VIDEVASLSVNAAQRRLHDFELETEVRDWLDSLRKTRQHDQRQIDRAVRVQKTCERDHHGPAAESYERQV